MFLHHHVPHHTPTIALCSYCFLKKSYKKFTEESNIIYTQTACMINGFYRKIEERRAKSLGM